MAQQKFEKKTTEQEEVERGLQEQAAILEQDDIVDYDSESDDKATHAAPNGKNHDNNITASGLDSRAMPVRPSAEATPDEETQSQETTTTSNAAFAPVLQEMEIQSNKAGSDKVVTLEKTVQQNQAAAATINAVSTPVLKERNLQSRNAEIVVLDDSDDGSDTFAGFKEI